MSTVGFFWVKLNVIVDIFIYNPSENINLSVDCGYYYHQEDEIYKKK